MKLIRKCLVILAMAAIAGYGFFEFRTSCYQNTSITLYSSGGQPDMFRLFYNPGFGINERESVNFFKDSINTGKIEFEIPGSWFRQLRIDPGSKSSKVRVDSITFCHDNHRTCLAVEYPSGNVPTLNSDIGLLFDDNELIVRPTRSDSHIGFTQNIRQFIDFQVDWAKTFFLVIKILLVFAVVIVLSYFSYEIRNRVIALFLNLPHWLPFLTCIKPQKVFIYAAVVWGLILVFVTPPFQSPDEFFHFFRIYQISRLKILPFANENMIGGNVPESFFQFTSGYQKIPFNPENKVSVKKILNDFDIPLHPENTIFTFHSNSCQYTPVPYTPQALLMALPVQFNAPPLLLFYSGRLGNLLFWIILVYLAISITPVFKWVFVMLPLMPMSIFQASTLSPDGLTNGLSFLLIAYVLKLVFVENRKITVANIAMMLTMAFFLSLSKTAYFVLIASILIIPLSGFSSKGRWFVLFSGSLAVVVAAMVINHIYLQHVFGQVDVTNGLYAFNKGYPQDVHPEKQLLLMFQDLPGFITVVVGTFGQFWKAYAVGWVGNLGWHDTPFPPVFVSWAYLAMIITALFDSSAVFGFRVWQKIIISCIAAGVILSVLTIIYATWAPLGSKIIYGIQGRYFIPAGPLFLLMLHNRKLHALPGLLSAFVLLNIVVFFSVTIGVLLLRYYL